MIEIKNLSKRFSNRTVLEDINLSIKRGEIFGIFGPNGAGKTTLIKIIATLLRPSSGRVSIGGLDIIKDRLEIKKKIGLVSHETFLYDELTAEENLIFYAKLYGVKPSIEETLTRVGLEEYAKTLVKNFSHGMKKRLTIARALLNKPEVLLLDEASAGLDLEAREDFYRTLKILNSEGGTILLSTHYSEETRLCNRVALINKKILKVVDGNGFLNYSKEGFNTRT